MTKKPFHSMSDDFDELDTAPETLSMDTIAHGRELLSKIAHFEPWEMKEILDEASKPSGPSLTASSPREFDLIRLIADREILTAMGAAECSKLRDFIFAYDALRADHDEICQAYLNKLSDYSDLYAELMAERNTLARSASEWSRRSIELKAEAEKLAEALAAYADRKNYTYGEFEYRGDYAFMLAEAAITRWKEFIDGK